ncbi:MAG: hypothetical protein IT256_00435, partial [Chitinophagaceae bacterium]|nr:hypothetical protein [Chitinophagaceae bacterium]
VGLQHLYTSSESSHPSLFAGTPNEESEQQYNNLQIWGRYQLSQKFQLFGFLPYIANTNSSNGTSSHASGIGDASLILNYAIPLPEKVKSKQMLLAGIGIKMPFGKFNSSTNTERNGLPNTQTGTGSWDILSNINYTQKGTKWGYNLDAAYIYTTANSAQYKFGNRTNIVGTAFYWLKHKQLTIVPQAGIRVEHALHDYDNYSKKWLNEKTGGIMSFGTVGMQCYYKKIGIKTNLSIPMYQQYAAGYVLSHARIESGIFLLF